MKEKFLVPALVPCNNSGKNINRTIYSVLLQTWENIEFIILNSRSTNSARDQIIYSNSTTPNIKFYSQSNQGLTAERNNGVRISNEKFVMPSIRFNKFGYVFTQNRKKYSSSHKLFNPLTIYKKLRNSDLNRKLLIYFVFFTFPLKVRHFSYSSLIKKIRNLNIKIKQNEK